MHPWFVWIYWINPLTYGFEALLANEFKDQMIPCANNHLIPNYLPEYQNSAFQACAGIGGARPGATVVSGEEYLASLSYSSSHIWRNVGILLAYLVFFVGLTIVFTLGWDDASGSSGALVVPREMQKVTRMPASTDVEAQASEKQLERNATREEVDTRQNGLAANLLRNTSIFTWRNLSYVVKTPSGDRKLLENVNGYVKPGMLGALMGSSGAGKVSPHELS